MKIIYNRYLPFGRFTALTVLVWLLVKRPAAVTPPVRLGALYPQPEVSLSPARDAAPVNPYNPQTIDNSRQPAARPAVLYLRKNVGKRFA